MSVSSTDTHTLGISDRGQLAVIRGQHRLLDAIETPPQPVALRWVWLVIIGIVVIAAAVAFVYCRSHGYKGFTGSLEAAKGPFGVKIGIKIGCY
jgi:hypothetical protein